MLTSPLGFLELLISLGAAGFPVGAGSVLPLNPMAQRVHIPTPIAGWARVAELANLHCQFHMGRGVVIHCASAGRGGGVVICCASAGRGSGVVLLQGGGGVLLSTVLLQRGGRVL
jgi:hypothetical protein